MLERGAFSVNCREKDDWDAFVDACKAKRSEDLLDGPFGRLVASYPAYADRVYNRFHEAEVLQGNL